MPPGHDGIDCSFGIPLARAAKVENCVVKRSPPQDGQSVESPARRTSFSNFVPHSSQRYSKIGIVYSVSSNAILSIHLRTSELGAVKLLAMIENASHPCVLLWA